MEFGESKEDIDDLVRLVFDELELGLFDFLRCKRNGLLSDGFIVLLMLWYYLCCVSTFGVVVCWNW
jgi:hypothetical protein